MARVKTEVERSVGAKADSKKTVTFEYIKSQFFRVIHADGAIGALTPSGNIHIAFYSERPAIPDVMVHQRNEDGSLGAVLLDKIVGKSCIIREMDVDVIIDPSAIDALITWLGSQKKRHKDRKPGVS